MDPTRVHLFITHLPVFGLFLGFLALAYGFIRNDRQVKIVSLSIVLIATIGAFIAFQTGEGAEETAEHIAGVSEDVIHEHEESAEFAILFFYGVGILSLVALYLEAKSKRYARELSLAVLALTAVTFFIVARTATLGGKIRHTEIVDGNGASPDVRSEDDH
ncbi:MAG: hypothetical protein WA874_21225 [Chryseosolibacter sp.]